MCRLFGITADKPVDVEFSLMRGAKSFRSMGRDNPDGWGIGWYERGRPRTNKQPISAADFDLYPAVAARARSDVFVAHVRLRTEGRPHTVNCHPFSDGRWLFGAGPEHRYWVHRIGDSL